MTWIAPVGTILEDRIRQRAEEFVGELDTLVREIALSAISESLSSVGPATSGSGLAGSGLAGSGGLVGSGGLAGSGLAGSGLECDGSRRHVKRRSSEIGALMERIQGYVQEFPGQGVEEISRGLGVSSRELSLPIKRLLASNLLSKQGQKRSTRYFPA